MPKVLLMFGMTNRRIILVRNGSKITARKLHCWQHNLSGPKMSTELLKSYLQVLSQLWRNAMNLSNLESQNSSTRLPNLWKYWNVWKLSTLSPLMCTLEMLFKTLSIKESMKLSHSLGSLNSNLNGHWTRTKMSLRGSFADSHGKPTLRNTNASSRSLTGSDSTHTSIQETLSDWSSLLLLTDATSLSLKHLTWSWVELQLDLLVLVKLKQQKILERLLVSLSWCSTAQIRWVKIQWLKSSWVSVNQERGDVSMSSIVFLLKCCLSFQLKSRLA